VEPFNGFDFRYPRQCYLDASQLIQQIDCVSEIFRNARCVEPEDISSGMTEKLVDDCI